MNKNYIKVHLPQEISLASCLQFVEALMNHPSIDNIQIAYGGSTGTNSKSQKLDSFVHAALRQKYQEIGRMLDSFEKGDPND